METFLSDDCQFSLERLIAHRPGVLELAEPLVRKVVEIAVGHDLFQGSAPTVSHNVLGVREPAQQVLRTVVERFFDEVVAEPEIGLAFPVVVRRPFAVEDLTHENVTQTGFVVSQIRCRVPSVFGFSTHFGCVLVCYFVPVGIEKK